MCRSRLYSIKVDFYSNNEKSLFEQPFGDLGLGVTYTLHLYLVGKPVVDFPFVIIEHFALFLMVDTL